jgi:hypothetical protein
MYKSTSIAPYCCGPLQAPNIVNIVTDIHQIGDGYGIPRLANLFHLHACVSSAVVPVYRHKKNGNNMDHSTFVVYYSYRDISHRTCNDASEILVFRKS